jgi:hypothetical protein
VRRRTSQSTTFAEVLGGLEYDWEQIRRVEGAGFLGVWIDARIKWRGHVDQVGTKVWQLLDEHLLLSLYNSMVFPHLQYCLMVWGDFEASRNGAYGETRGPGAYILDQSPKRPKWQPV